MLRGGAIIHGSEDTAAATAHADLDAMTRLEALVRTLVVRHRELAAQCAALRERAEAQQGALTDRDSRIAALEGELRVSNQLRVDVGKRIDDLLGQFDQLEQSLTPAEPAD